MVKLTVGQVVSSSFPFSNLTTHKYRPALVVAKVDFGDIILCQITSKPYSSSKPVSLKKDDFSVGGLPVNGFVRPDKLFTAEATIVNSIHGEITTEKLHEIHAVIRSLFTLA